MYVRNATEMTNIAMYKAATTLTPAGTLGGFKSRVQVSFSSSWQQVCQVECHMHHEKSSMLVVLHYITIIWVALHCAAQRSETVHTRIHPNHSHLYHTSAGINDTPPS